MDKDKSTNSGALAGSLDALGKGLSDEFDLIPPGKIIWQEAPPSRPYKGVFQASEGDLLDIINDYLDGLL